MQGLEKSVERGVSCEKRGIRVEAARITVFFQGRFDKVSIGLMVPCPMRVGGNPDSPVAI